MLVNTDGATLDRWVGYGKSYFITTLGEALLDLSTIAQKLDRYGSKPTVKDAAVLGRYYAAMDDYQNAVKYYSSAQELNSDPGKDYSYNIFDNIAGGYGKDLYSFEQVTQAADRALESKVNSPSTVVSVAYTMLSVDRKNGYKEDVSRFLKRGLEVTANSDDPEMRDNHARLIVEYTLLVDKDTTKAVEYKRAAMPEGWMDNAGQLNEFSWWCFENRANLQEAQQLARKAVGLAQPGREKAMILDTLAEICNALNDCTESVELTKQAIKEDPNDEYFKEQLKRFEEILASSK